MNEFKQPALSLILFLYTFISLFVFRKLSIESDQGLAKTFLIFYAVIGVQDSNSLWHRTIYQRYESIETSRVKVVGVKFYSRSYPQFEPNNGVMLEELTAENMRPGSQRRVNNRNAAKLIFSRSLR